MICELRWKSSAEDSGRRFSRIREELNWMRSAHGMMERDTLHTFSLVSEKDESLYFERAKEVLLIQAAT